MDSRPIKPWMVSGILSGTIGVAHYTGASRNELEVERMGGMQIMWDHIEFVGQYSGRKQKDYKFSCAQVVTPKLLFTGSHLYSSHVGSSPKSHHRWLKDLLLVNEQRNPGLG